MAPEVENIAHDVGQLVYTAVTGVVWDMGCGGWWVLREAAGVDDDGVGWMACFMGGGGLQTKKGWGGWLVLWEAAGCRRRRGGVNGWFCERRQVADEDEERWMAGFEGDEDGGKMLKGFE